MPLDSARPSTQNLRDEIVHRRLVVFNRWRTSPRKEETDYEAALRYERALRLEENRFVERERQSLARTLDDVPRQPESFLRWYENLRNTGPGQNDPLFPWLAQEATLDQMRWFLEQEIASESGFGDLVALTQVKMPNRPKLELARNYWDEMGRGQESGMHGLMLENLAEELELSHDVEAVWEVQALANLMMALASNRHFSYQSLGALGAIELTAPVRADAVNRGLKRLGVNGAARQYYAVHATLDLKHSEDWNAEILAPLVEKDESLARLLAEGALLRLRAGARCYERYRLELGL